jgi:hypothetical protein
MLALTKNEILDELTKFGIYTPSELRLLLMEYRKYYSHDYFQIISPHE